MRSRLNDARTVRRTRRGGAYPALLELRGVGFPSCRVQHGVDIFPGCRRQRHTDDLLQFVDGAGRARAARDDAPRRPGVHGFLDRLLGLVQQLRHAAAGDVILGMRVCVDTLQALQVGLHETQAAPRRRVVTIHHEPFAERRVECRIYPDDLLAQKAGAQFFFSQALPLL